MADELAIFQERIRKVWFEGQWWFSVVDAVGALTDSPKPCVYWGVLKRRLRTEGASELITNCKQLKMRSADGKFYSTDAADTETLLPSLFEAAVLETLEETQE